MKMFFQQRLLQGSDLQKVRIFFFPISDSAARIHLCSPSWITHSAQAPRAKQRISHKMIVMLFTSILNISFITEITKIDKELKSFPLPPPKLQKAWQAMRELDIVKSHIYAPFQYPLQLIICFVRSFKCNKTFCSWFSKSPRGFVSKQSLQCQD